MYVGTHHAHTCAHTHSLFHSGIFLFYGFEPLALQGLRDTGSRVHLKPVPHTIPHAPMISGTRQGRAPLSPHTWDPREHKRGSALSERGSQKNLSSRLAEHPAEAKQGCSRSRASAPQTRFLFASKSSIPLCQQRQISKTLRWARKQVSA